MTDLGVGLYQIYYYWVQTCDMLDGMGTGLVGPVVGYASDIELGVRTALEVTWPSQVGTNYVVQWTTNMSSGPWLFVTNVTGAAGTSSVLRSLQPGPRGYYRVIVE
jgi:hypothetical protein